MVKSNSAIKYYTSENIPTSIIDEDDDNEQQQQQKQKQQLQCQQQQLEIELLSKQQYQIGEQKNGVDECNRSRMYTMNQYMCNKINRMMDTCEYFIEVFAQKYGGDNLAFSLSIIGGIFHVTSSIYLKMNRHIDWSIGVFYRGLFSAILTYGLGSIRNKKMLAEDGEDMKYLLIRCITATIGLLYFCYAINMIPLSILYIALNTGPIFVFLLGYFFFNNSITKSILFGVFISFFGVLLVTSSDLFQPLLSSTFQTHQQQDKQTDSMGEESNGKTYSVGWDKYLIIIGLLVSQVIWAYGILVVRYLKNVDSFGSNFWLGSFFFITSSIIMCTRVTSVEGLRFYDYLNLSIFCGVAGFLNQICFVSATQLTKKHGQLTILNYFMVIESLLIEIFFFHETPNFIQLTGSFLVLFGIFKVQIKK